MYNLVWNDWWYLLGVSSRRSVRSTREWSTWGWKLRVDDRSRFIVVLPYEHCLATTVGIAASPISPLKNFPLIWYSQVKNIRSQRESLFSFIWIYNILPLNFRPRTTAANERLVSWRSVDLAFRSLDSGEHRAASWERPPWSAWKRDRKPHIGGWWKGTITTAILGLPPAGYRQLPSSNHLFHLKESSYS